MSKKKKTQSGSQESRAFDANEIRTPVDVPDPEVQREFAEAAHGVRSGQRILAGRLGAHTSESPDLAGGDIDAAWDQPDSGEELPGGSSTTPDQNDVEDNGAALGLTFEDDEPVDAPEKLARRDRRRWELKPASSEDFAERQADGDPAGGPPKSDAA